jgi:hypothetical protein
MYLLLYAILMSFEVPRRQFTQQVVTSGVLTSATTLCMDMYLVCE